MTVQYTGWANDGRMFDSSLTRPMPSMFPLNRAMAGWRECVGLMVLHEVRRCWVPEALGYKGAAGRPKGTVVFDIELLDTRAVADDRATRCEGAAGRRQEDGGRRFLQGAAARHRHPAPHRLQQGHRPLLRLDDGWKAVRQLDRARQPRPHSTSAAASSAAGPKACR